ncbi:craniofacial development protein 2-like [Camellia sinensis]|uniref:craniofacial development protein 2-like n=1 Tax=Camellia sinensis TaxID=4442 RepID=UPI001035B928|nr:craniofacial development protein 2-like [Camellia sinensis]
MDEVLQEIPVGENLVIGGDFNGHVGVDKKKVHGGYDFGDRNKDAESILDFILTFDLVVANTMYKKRDEHLVTFNSGSIRSQIDYFIVRKGDRLKRNNCKVIPRGSLTSQHRILILYLCFKNNTKLEKIVGAAGLDSET